MPSPTPECAWRRFCTSRARSRPRCSRGRPRREPSETALPPTSCGWHKANVTRPEDESRVLGARFGANPNSSSLGVDVTFLLFGATFASAVALVLGAFLRARGSDATQVGDSVSQE